MQFAPALLDQTFEDFAVDVKKVEGLFSYAQIDVMDGEFVPNISFPNIEKINDLHSPLRWELHLMVTNPLAEMQKWSEVKNIFRVIFHSESKDSPKDCIAFARGKCWEVGMAFNPKTGLEIATPHFDQLNVVQFMTVTPGKQGGVFLSEVGEKIKTFTALTKRPLCAVDGGVNTETITQLKEWNVDIANIGSALLRAPDIAEAYRNLTTLIGQ